MKTRVLTGIGIFLVGVPLIIFSEYIVYSIALGLLSLMATFELLRALSLHKNCILSVPAFLISFALPLFAHSIFVKSTEHINYIAILFLVLFVFLLYLAFAAVFSKGKITFASVSSVFLAVTYISVAFTSLSLLRYMELGVYLFGMVFIGAWVCDTFAYFTGMLLGKHKLIPELSPKKTVEGSLGGIVFTVLAFLLYGFIIEKAARLDANYLVLALTGLLLSVISQLGDLFASLIKRELGIKDYGRLLPGHGGIMDRFDSIIAVSGVLMMICILFPPFTAV